MKERKIERKKGRFKREYLREIKGEKERER